MQKLLTISFLITILTAACYKEADFSKKELNPDNIILSMAQGRNTLLATGSDTTLITIELPLEASDSGSTVTFETNNGLFLPAAKPEARIIASIIVENGVKKKLAKVIYQAPSSAGSANVSAKIASSSKSVDITIARNYADSLTITPSTLVLEASPSIEMSFLINLFSKAGKVTPGQRLSLSVKDTNNADKGSFRIKADKSNDAGQASFTYTLMPDTAYRGRLIVRSKTEEGPSFPSDPVTIYIIKK